MLAPLPQRPHEALVEKGSNSAAQQILLSTLGAGIGPPCSEGLGRRVLPAGTDQGRATV